MDHQSPFLCRLRRSRRTCRSVTPISSAACFWAISFLLGLLQGHQPVSLSLGHKQMSFVHPPGSTLSIGHFYFAQIGHYYFGASIPVPCAVCLKPVRCMFLPVLNRVQRQGQLGVSQRENYCS